ncbi:corticotropin-releasing factor receptor 2-like protein [Labeo rohita]|uniref:Corticotropin-releasing factor receptor 2-like protein n=1 Tax=Labeo rohita TaxID=84645 RepID=A0A498M521_LABRO|nr:corticotropin-releasing factor receptor 2-like protein [Labeo rohita]
MLPDQIKHNFGIKEGIAYRECLDNGTWALKSNYSNCEPILEEKVGIPCPIIITWAIGKLYNENEQKAVKATLVLLPLLGITYMLFFVNPGEDDISQIVFIYFNSFLQSFQGFFVSVFYCFLNGEVRSAARKRWHRWQDNHALRVRVARAMSIPTSPTRISFHSIKQTTAV